MFKIVFDVKCGYEGLYMTEKNAEFPLDFLADKAKIVRALPKTNPDDILTQKELFKKYKNRPSKILVDFNLYPIIRECISEDYKASFFIHGNTDLFPELFVLENLRLEYDGELPEDDYRDEIGDKGQ